MVKMKGLEKKLSPKEEEIYEKLKIDKGLREM